MERAGDAGIVGGPENIVVGPRSMEEGAAVEGVEHVAMEMLECKGR